MCSNELKQVYQISGIGSSPLEDQCGMTQGMRYCCAITINPSMEARISMPAIVLVITVSFDVPLLTLDYAPAPIFTEKGNESYTVQ